MHAITLTPSHLHAILGDAHGHLADGNAAGAKAALAVLLRLTAPAAALPQGLAMRLLPVRGEEPHSGFTSLHQRMAEMEEAQPAMRHTARRVTVWTAERQAALRARFPDSTDDAALLAHLNTRPGGGPIASVEAMRKQADELGIRRGPAAAEQLRRARSAAANKARHARTAAPSQAEAAPPAATPADPPIEIPPPPTTAAIPAAAPPPEPPRGPAFIARATTPEQDKAEAWECFAKGWTVRQVREDFCVLMDTAAAWYAEWQRAQVPA